MNKTYISNAVIEGIYNAYYTPVLTAYTPILKYLHSQVSGEYRMAFLEEIRHCYAELQHKGGCNKSNAQFIIRDMLRNKPKEPELQKGTVTEYCRAGEYLDAVEQGKYAKVGVATIADIIPKNYPAMVRDRLTLEDEIAAKFTAENKPAKPVEPEPTPEPVEPEPVKSALFYKLKDLYNKAIEVQASCLKMYPELEGQ